MGIESGNLKEEENKKKKLSEKQIQENNKKTIEHKKVKETISVEMEAEHNLSDLKDLVDKGVITKETAENIVEKVDIGDDIVKEIFEKIDKLDDIKDIDNYLPEDLRITKEEYSKALVDDIFRVQMITKLNSALTLLANKINPDSSVGLNLFSGYLTVLDKNLIIVQENTIEVKDSLEKVEEEKFGKKEDTRSIWKKILDFIKEAFS